MRRSRAASLATAAFLSAVTLATAITPAAAQTTTGACDQSVVSVKVSGRLTVCTWDDGRIRLVGTLRDKTLSDGATLLGVKIGTYSREWVICGSDIPVDTDYQPSGAVSLRWQTISAANC
ncbi:hypothetical protein [Streptomyces sp. NRRL S-920]|uniref:hypothetical protein n=1 Tax=Streptomyces sp. NRRL S-920 TaxID=1463921 RepID=UPI0004C5E5C3|nr:hypothetical protein [Streptomyces sp. NRRL S-920]